MYWFSLMKSELPKISHKVQLRGSSEQSGRQTYCKGAYYSVACCSKSQDSAWSQTGNYLYFTYIITVHIWPVVGKLLLKSSGVTLITLLVKATRYFLSITHFSM